MKQLISRSFLLFIGMILSCAVYSQGRGGGFGAGGQNQGSQSQEIVVEFRGRWTFEFQLLFDSEDPEALGEEFTFSADVEKFGQDIRGRLRNTEGDGEFSCTLAFGSTERCENGFLRIRWRDNANIVDEADFGFDLDLVTPQRVRAIGWANFTNRSTGGIRQYKLDLAKR